MFSRRTILTLAACLPVSVGAQSAAPIAVVASFTILADFACAVGGARVRVASLVGPNQDAHTYQPRPSDSRAVAAARVMIVNGLGFEGWGGRLAGSAGFKGVSVVASAGARVLSARGLDPHAWQDAANAKAYVRNIEAGLTTADPASAEAYAAAAQAYLDQLDLLDRDIRAAWAAIPRANRRIVTSHDAFTYYGDAYGVDFLAPQGIAADAEPTPRQLAALIRQIKAERIRAVFVESIANAQLLQQVARDTGARIGPPVFSDALSDPAGPAGSYLAMMRHNTQSFIAALA